MNEPQPISPRHRLQELLSIPERQRTDAQWDEINELEITLTAVNRAETHAPGVRRNAPASADKPKPSGGTQGKKPFKRIHKRPPK
ncbi:MAG: hypothetical protein Q8O38_04075 [Sulfurimicrobium sp.]|nr:hypothetical protein [Sulfurimicrobium sp.]